MNCPQCGAPVVCVGCGAAVVEPPSAPVQLPEKPAAGRPRDASTQAIPSHTYLVVAKGHQDLLAQLQSVVGEFGWVSVIEDRRDDPSLLPRTGREGAVRVDEEIEP